MLSGFAPSIKRVARSDASVGQANIEMDLDANLTGSRVCPMTREAPQSFSPFPRHARARLRILEAEADLVCISIFFFR